MTHDQEAQRWIGGHQREVDSAEDALKRYLLSDFSEDVVFHFLTKRLTQATERLNAVKDIVRRTELANTQS